MHCQGVHAMAQKCTERTQRVSAALDEQPASEVREIAPVALYGGVERKRTASLYEHVNKITVTPTMSPLGINAGSGAGACTCWSRSE